MSLFDTIIARFSRRAVAVCEEIRDDYNKHVAGKAYTCRRHGHGLCVRDRRPDPFIGSAEILMELFRFHGR